MSIGCYWEWSNLLLISRIYSVLESFTTSSATLNSEKSLQLAVENKYHGTSDGSERIGTGSLEKGLASFVLHNL